MTAIPADAPSGHEPGRGWLARLRWLVPVAFLGVTVWLVWRELSAFNARELQRTLLHVPTRDAVFAAALALFAVAFTGSVDWVIARWLKLEVRARELLRLSFVANAMANTLNLSGAIGSGVRLLGFSGYGVPMRRSAALVGLQVLSLPLGLSALVIATLASGALPVTPNAATRWLAIAVLIAAALYLPLYLMLTGRRRLMRWLPEEQGLPPMRLKLTLALLSLADWLLAAASLWFCLEIAGAHVSATVLLGAYTGAAVLGLASMIPGGFGVFDGLLLLALSAAGVPGENITVGLILFRVVYYLLPLLFALWLGAGMLAQRVPALTRARTRLAAHPLFAVLGLPVTLLGNLGVRLLAYLTFFAGALQLVTTAIPSIHERVIKLHKLLPIEAIESSHLLSVVIGVLLLGLARGIDGRLRVAYRMVQWLLWISAILALTKGLHWIEALFLLSVSGLLRTRRADFSRAAMNLSSARTWSWLIGLLVVVGLFFALGVAAVIGDDSFDFFAVGPGEHASRLARGATAALIGLVLYLMWQAFAVRRSPLPLPNRAQLERARNVYRQHGGGEFAHLTLMGDKHLFWAADHAAVIAYGTIRDRLVALGTPSGPEPAIERAILDFRRFADHQDRVPVFYEVLEPDLHRYHDLGFDLFKLGELATVPLAEFSLAGKRWEDLRAAVNRAQREKLTFQIAEPPFDTALLDDLERVSEAWLADRNAAEKGFSLGRFDPEYFSWSPIALVRREGELVAFANIQPPYGPNGTASVDLMRQTPDAPRGSMDFLFAQVMQWAQHQGHERFSLGMAPLSNVGIHPYARINEQLAALAFRYGNRLYNYQGLRRYKDKFKPEWTGAYLAYPRGLWVPGLLLDITALVAGGYRRLILG
ncbi:MAG TPA: bifunctional lysylphosphatidylglycerol flippase/synthetase MprF [Rhodanobacteraceae bacterium]|nr:bifunctional lysylphosphatidylglycerol flippase/synthetase MprF [Rhodanobacteraceae bacterium]